MRPLLLLLVEAFSLAKLKVSSIRTAYHVAGCFWDLDIQSQ